MGRVAWAGPCRAKAEQEFARTFKITEYRTYTRNSRDSPYHYSLDSTLGGGLKIADHDRRSALRVALSCLIAF